MNHSTTYFTGPKGENLKLLRELAEMIIDHHQQKRQSAFPDDPSLYTASPADSALAGKLKDELKEILSKGSASIPFFHPRYTAQMLKDPSIPAIAGYLAYILDNPNNHAYEGGPVTTGFEMEVVDLMLKFTGLNEGWGHLTSGGSLANMEALWAARDYYRDGGGVCFSEVSHYSWKRICNILRIDDYSEIPVDSRFRMDVNALEDQLKRRRIMFVMANLGSTGTGSVDDIEAILALKEKYGFHLHIDAAYGGFLRSVCLDENYSFEKFSTDMPISRYLHRQMELLCQADSVTIDPHKHGLIQYGAGAVLYRDENLRAPILNTAPYTYHKQDKPNIGMFSLEGSRPGAIAAACYLTYKVLPPNKTGIGQVAAESLKASKKFYELCALSGKLRNLNYPDLDINCFYPEPSGKSISAVNALSAEVYNRFSVEAEAPEFIISKFITPASIAQRVLPEYKNRGNENLTVLRSVFMKHWNGMDDYYYVNKLIEALEA